MKTVELSVKDTNKIFYDLGDNKELFISVSSDGKLNISVDGANILVAPKGSNSIELVLVK